MAQYGDMLICKRICGIAGEKTPNGRIISEGFVYLEGDNKRNTIKVIVPEKNIKASFLCGGAFAELCNHIGIRLIGKFFKK